MSLLDTESSLLAQIQVGLEGSGYKAEAFPEKPDQYTLTHPVGVVLLVFQRTSFGKPGETDMIVQEITHSWDAVILARNLRSHQGAYAIVDRIRKALTGFKPTGGLKAWIERTEFLGQNEGVWQYGLSISVPAMNVEDLTLPTGPILEHITSNSTIPAHAVPTGGTLPPDDYDQLLVPGEHPPPPEPEPDPEPDPDPEPEPEPEPEEPTP